MKHSTLCRAAMGLQRWRWLPSSVVGCGAASSASSSTLLAPRRQLRLPELYLQPGGWTPTGPLGRGVSALDYVTLPEDYAAIPLKKSDVEPSEEGHPDPCGDNLLESNRVNQPGHPARPAETGDIANIDYSGTVDGGRLYRRHPPRAMT